MDSNYVSGVFTNPTDPDLAHLPHSVAQATYARRGEYTQPKSLRVKITTWNLGAADCTSDIGPCVVKGHGIDPNLSRLSLSTAAESAVKLAEDQEPHPSTESIKHQEASVQSHAHAELAIPLGDNLQIAGGEDIDLYVVGFQEVIELTTTNIVNNVKSGAARYKDALTRSLPDSYVLIAERQLVGILLLIYASPTLSPDVKSSVTAEVRTGKGGWGNKGAVSAHLILGEATRLTFTCCHMAAMTSQQDLERRNWDASTILSKTEFPNIQDPDGFLSRTETLAHGDFAFWFGDLNYRLDSQISNEDVRKLLSAHCRNEYDQTIPARDAAFGQGSSYMKVSDDSPALLQTVLSSLLRRDELLQQIKARKAFHQGWREGPIKFLPTYRYDSGTFAIYDSSDKKRTPSWCDRILFRTKLDYENYQKAAAELDGVSASKNLSDRPTSNVLFEMPEDFNETPSTEPEELEKFEDAALQLQCYVAHQRLISSDHKPLTAVFTMPYQAVDHKKRHEVEFDVRRELDKQQNKRRPDVVIAFDQLPKLVAESGETPSQQKKAANSSQNTVHFGQVVFGQEATISASIANRGLVPAVLSFANRPSSGLGEEGPTPPWLSLKFDRPADRKDKKNKDKAVPTYTIDTGVACTVSITLLVNTESLKRDLDDGIVELQEVLILRVKDAGDQFLEVKGDWQKALTEEEGV